MLEKLDSISAWAILVIGFVHISAVFHFFPYLVEPGSTGVRREPVLWWCAVGIASWFGGTFNVLRFRYGERLPAIIRLTFAVNLTMAAFEIWLLVNNPSFLLPARMLLLVSQAAGTLFTVAAWRRVQRVAESAGDRPPAAGTTSKYDSFSVWLIFIFAAAGGLSVFYFFQPLVQPGATETAREPALWWVSGHMALVFCGGLNYLRLRYGSMVRPLIWASLVTTTISLYFVLLLLADNPLFFLVVRVPLLVGLAGAFFTTLLSLQSAPDDRRT